MSEFLLTISGFFFLVSYVEIIRVGFRDKTYGMPIASIVSKYNLGIYIFFYFAMEVYNNI